MSTIARRRLFKDLKKFEAEKLDGVTAAPDTDNLMEWQAVIYG